MQGEGTTNNATAQRGLGKIVGASVVGVWAELWPLLQLICLNKKTVFFFFNFQPFPFTSLWIKCKETLVFSYICFTKHTALEVTSWTGPGGRGSSKGKSLSVNHLPQSQFSFWPMDSTDFRKLIPYGWLILRPTCHVYQASSRDFLPNSRPVRAQTMQTGIQLSKSVTVCVYSWKQRAASDGNRTWTTQSKLKGSALILCAGKH